ncbi:MAG TPA: ATP-binding protein, partial [Cyclobacteriaceae bacterium]|nr:ATP-binding protein [Cyclobacteriaceae bacterium]
INLRNFIRGILDEVRESVKNQRAIGLNYATKLEKLHVDDKLLRNIIINLLTNALKFSAAHTIVAFSIYDHSNYVVFEVKDEGIGIAENDLKNIFEPFQRASNSVDIPGTGLGLSIAKRAVDLMEGSIEVESKVNEGSLFRVMIPVK